MGINQMTKYESVAAKLTAYINDSNTKSRKLPTERDLCQIYNVSRQTIREALLLLEEDHLITKVQGSGIYIDETYFASRNKIAIILKEEDEYIYPEWVLLFKKALKQEGYMPEFFFTHNKSSLERKILNQISNTPLRGIIAEPVKSIFNCPNEALYESLRQKGIPTLFFMDNYDNMPSYPYIKYDDYSGSYSVTKNICSFKEPVYAVFLTDDNIGKNRYEGFLQSILDNGYEIDENRICFISESDIVLIRKHLQPDKLPAFISDIKNGHIICQDDEIAFYIYKHISDKDIHNVHIYSFDQSYLMKLCENKINSYAPDKELLIHEAVIGIISLIQNKAFISKQFNPCIHEATYPGSF